MRFVDRDGNAVEYGHDARGNTISESWYDASGCLTRTIAYAFDRYDRLTAVDDAGTDYAYAYDHLGRLRSETVTRDGSVTVLHYDYDRRGQVSRVSAVVDGRADFVTEYRYDLSGRLREIAQHGVEGGNPVLAKRATIDYDRFAGTMTIRRYEGDSLVVETVQQYAWVARPDKGVANLGGVLHSASDPSRSGTPLPDMPPGTDAISLVLAGITHVGPNGQPLVGHEYAYNDSGLIESYENSVDGTSDYAYDPTGQLITADHETQPDEQYAYDANGNRIDYFVGPANQVLCDGVYWYAYDNEGHRTERYQWIDADGDGKADREEKFDRTQYAWDARGRLVKIVTKPDGQTKSRVVHYDYDYQNRRVEKIVNDFDSDGEKTKTVERYLYTGQDIVLQTDQRGEITHRYLHGPAVDQCLADERVLDDNILYPLFDNLGTIRDIADHDPTTGQTVIANHIVYSCYGVIISQTNPTQSTLYGLGGREIDPESGEYYLRGRYYDAALQQLISEDPISFWAGDPNPRRYCGNSPVNKTDPSGLHGVEIEVLDLTTGEFKTILSSPSSPLPEGCVPARFFKRFSWEGMQKPLPPAKPKYEGPSIGPAPAPGSPEYEWQHSWQNPNYQRWLIMRSEWARTITAESPDTAEKKAIRGRGYWSAGSMYSPYFVTPRQDTQIVLKAAGNVPVVGAPALALDAGIHLKHGEYEQAAYSAFGVALHAGAAYMALRPAAGAVPGKIATPWGTAVQEESAAALQVRSQIQQGAPVYKGGVLGRSETGASQFLATESPLNPGYAGRYGLPPSNAEFDFILGGRVRAGAPVITRSAPGIPPNPGGGIEGVINSGDFQIEWFHMP